MRIRLVLGVVGQLLRSFCFAFVPPLLLALYDRHWETAAYFMGVGLLSYLLGVLYGQGLSKSQNFHRSEALAVVAMTWLSVGVLGAFPYFCEGLSPVDSLFESISGFTTTGATVFQDFSHYDRPIFLWRAMSQWFGGLGVIALFVVVLPRLGIAGRQLFFAEASGAPAEAVSPQVRNSAEKLWMLYVALTTVLGGLLFAAGMSGYDAILHALTTMSAGGFSTNAESIAGFHNPAVEWVLVVFMLIAGTSFPLLYRFVSGRDFHIYRDGEFAFYLLAAGTSALAIAGLLGKGWPGEPEIRAALFQAASLISSTGYASEDYNAWGDGARAMLIVLMVVGGCAGSAAGGPKAVRLLLALKHLVREIKRVLHPRAVMVIRHRGRLVSDEIMRGVFTLVLLYLGGYFAVGIVLALLGSDLVEAFSASIACLGNVGPAFGNAGPMGNFSHFSTAGKLVLTCAMWVGRLEIVTVLALLHPDVLRHLSWGGKRR